MLWLVGGNRAAKATAAEPLLPARSLLLRVAALAASVLATAMPSMLMMLTPEQPLAPPLMRDLKMLSRRLRPAAGLERRADTAAERATGSEGMVSARVTETCTVSGTTTGGGGGAAALNGGAVPPAQVEPEGQATPAELLVPAGQ